MRLLSIDGGGIRGIIPALVLADLERRTGRRTADLFDLVAGTSTGGILACALTIPGAKPASDVVRLYRERGPRIFRRSLWQRVSSVEGLVDEKHDARELVRALRDELGDARLSDATTRVLVTAYDLVARTPYFFKSWRPDRDAAMVDVAHATAAAPTYFEPVALDGRSLVDGGVFATNPAMCAYAEARRLEPRRDCYVVSLGTGEQTRPIPHERAAAWGLVEWVRPLVDVVFDGVADAVDYQLRHVCADGEYVRLQTVLDRASDDLDDAGERNLRLLTEQARDLIAREEATLAEVARRLTRRD
ncbi:MAG TPA: CBASS cGAMP-activated phospholipase [Solirubrobacteraceae bacterium]|nr:CBASS cGAMP-activated phospholipase [Solirubrobacteraceae bacterium]